MLELDGEFLFLKHNFHDEAFQFKLNINHPNDNRQHYTEYPFWFIEKYFTIRSYTYKLHMKKVRHKSYHHLEFIF